MAVSPQDGVPTAIGGVSDMNRRSEIDNGALRRLHAERFAEVPLACGADLTPGIEDVEGWRDWSELPTTPDQYRIEAYIDRFDLRRKAILHVGAGNSGLAARFAGRARRIVGTTIVPHEVVCGEALDLSNYRIILHNKYRGHAGFAEGRFDIIVDNNPSTYCCCLQHFARMMEFYADVLAPGGQIVTDRAGLGWSLASSVPRWSFTAADLSAVAQLVGLATYEIRAQTVVLAREAPAGPTAAGSLRWAVRKGARLLARLLGRRGPVKR
jgi:hypothetical protein